MTALPPSGPERDRALAGKVRYGPRWAADLGDVAQSIMRDPEMQRRKRVLKVATALKTVLDERRRSRIKPVSFIAGTLTIDVMDGPLLAELKQYHESKLLDECARCGAGVSRIVWRLARAGAPPPPRRK